MLTQWFAANDRDMHARKYYTGSSHKHSCGIDGFRVDASPEGFAIGRLPYADPASGELLP